VPIEKEERCQRLVLRGRADACADRKIGEEYVDLLLSHRLRMPFRVEEHEAPHPRDVRFLGTQAVVARAHREPYSIEQARLPGARIDHRRPGARRRVRLNPSAYICRRADTLKKSARSTGGRSSESGRSSEEDQ
jgi:hypothetical protein